MDNHATTPVDPRVLEAMLPYFTEQFGNAASRTHCFGQTAGEASERARAQAADLIRCHPEEIVFTSGATESNNLALKGIIKAQGRPGGHIITACTEHSSILDTCKYLENQDIEVTYLPVDRSGLVDPTDLQKAIHHRTILVSIAYANNEIGVIQPIPELSRVARERGVLFHTDAVQAVGKILVDVRAMEIDLLSLTAHKIYGPKGIGALYVRKSPRVRLEAEVHGGGHEQGLRSGTLNVPGIVGFGKACELARQEMPGEAARLLVLRNRLRDSIMTKLPDVYLNGHPTQRLPGSLNLAFRFVEASAILMGMPEIALSSGSACGSDSLKPSHVLRALGLEDDLLYSSLRFGLGRFNTEEEVEYVVGRVTETVTRLREMSPLWEDCFYGNGI